MSLKYEPSSEPLHISAEQLFLNQELYRSVQLSVYEFENEMGQLNYFNVLSQAQPAVVRADLRPVGLSEVGTVTRVAHGKAVITDRRASASA